MFSCKLFNRTSSAGTDLFIKKISVQRSKDIIMDVNELRIKWNGRQLFEINDWIRSNQV